MSSMTKIAVATSLLIAAHSSASATVTYFYTGTDFTAVISPYTTSDKVTGYIVLSSPLLADSPLTYVQPVAFSFSDGVQTLSYTDTNSDTFIVGVGTGAGGSIDSWYISVAAQVNGVNLKQIVTTNITNSPGDAGVSAIVVPGEYVAGTTTTPGTWSAVPEPSTWAMMMAGFLGLGSLAYRRGKGDYFA